MSSDGGTAVAVVKLAEKSIYGRLERGDLYDLALSYGEDRVTSYFGLRSIQLTDKSFCSTENLYFSVSFWIGAFIRMEFTQHLLMKNWKRI